MKKDRGITKLPDGRLEIRARGRCPRTGRRKEKVRIVEDKGIKRARALQQELRAEIEAGVGQDVQRTTLTDYGRSWLRSKKVAGYRHASLAMRAQILEQHILPLLGDLYVDAITGQDVRDWLSDSAAKAKPNRKKQQSSEAGGAGEKTAVVEEEHYDPVTINGWLRILRTLIRDAVGDLGLDRDPTLRIKALTVEQDGKGGKALSAEELRRFIKAMNELRGEKKKRKEKKVTPTNCVLLLTGFFTGMRWEELSALEWQDIDEEAGCIHVRRAQVKGHLSGTKTRKTRTVAIPELVVAALKEHRQEQIRKQVKGLDKGLVFPSTKGGYREPSSIRRSLDNICELAKIERHVTPHWMRHTYNNLLRRAQVDRIVLRATTGHSSEEMTEHYSEVALEEKKEAAARVLKLVGMEGAA
jgi:integrase